MIYLPQHPVHYIFGMPTHAPLVIRAWINEEISFKIKFFAWYIGFFFLVGFAGGSVKAGLDMAGIVILATFMMGLPSAIFDPKDSKLLTSFSDSFFNAILSFHGFLLTYFVLYNVISLTAIFMGEWTLAVSNALIGLSFSLMVGFSIQQVIAVNKSVPWMTVPIMGISSGVGLLWFLGS